MYGRRFHQEAAGLIPKNNNKDGIRSMMGGWRRSPSLRPAKAARRRFCRRLSSSDHPFVANIRNPNQQTTRTSNNDNSNIKVNSISQPKPKQKNVFVIVHVRIVFRLWYLSRRQLFRRDSDDPLSPPHGVRASLVGPSIQPGTWTWTSTSTVAFASALPFWSAFDSHNYEFECRPAAAPSSTGNYCCTRYAFLADVRIMLVRKVADSFWNLYNIPCIA